MCYLIAKRMNKPGCIALQTEPGEKWQNLLMLYKKNLDMI